ncbi:MAG: hypothetical protein IJN27_01655 [Oscillospiraceae bacterium]|nr:hypothetical protein [Oscillospiraceae bacterium]
MAKMTVPRQKAFSVAKIDTFLGADLTNDPGYVDLKRSPDCPNIIRDTVGKIKKWQGYQTVMQLDGAINGCHTYYSSDGDKILYHAGTKLYGADGICYYSDMANERSQSRQLNGNLYILDGKKMLVFRKNKESGEFECVTAESLAYVPVIFISKDPQGGGEPYEPINLIQPKKTESFLGNDTDKVYQLAATEITSVDEVIEVTADGKKTLTEGTDYTVDLDLGTVTFTAAKKPVVTGEDNIKITYSKEVEGYSDRVNKCDICTLYGVDGARDRLFVAGNSDFGNRDYYSQLDNGLYFGDLWYTVVGADNSKIMGYTIISDNLATHLNRSDDDTNIVLRAGSTVDGEAAFTLKGSYQGTGAISKWSFGVLETEPLFLTVDGIYAVTPSDVLGERFAQLRSYYLNGLLLQQDLTNAYACIHDRFYMLACGEYIFALDGMQATREKNDPYSNRQYCGFYRTNVNARCIWEENGVLYFGCEDGKIKRFGADKYEFLSYNDDGEPIVARWTTPYILGDKFYAKKQYKKVHVLMAPDYYTSIDIWAHYDSSKELIYEHNMDLYICTFFWLVDFSKFSFDAGRTPRAITEKMNIKPEHHKAQFVFENGQLNETFTIYNIAIEFIEK